MSAAEVVVRDVEFDDGGWPPGRSVPSPSDARRFLQAVVGGQDPYDAAREVGGFTASEFKRLAKRHTGFGEAYALAKVERADGTKSYVRATLKQNAERAMQAQPVLDKNGAETGEYQYQGSVANRALELLGKDAGMFADRTEVDVSVEGEVTVSHDHQVTLRTLVGLGVIELGPGWPADAEGEPVLAALTDGAADGRPGSAPVPAADGT